MIEAGARGFRINFSHGTQSDFDRMLHAIRDASEGMEIPIAVMGDLPGPKIRVGQVVEGGVTLEAGSRVTFQAEPVVAGGDAGTVAFSTTFPPFLEEVRRGQRVLLDDGAVQLVCVERADGRLICEVVHGGVVTSNKGVNLPDTALSVPALTERDHRLVEYAVARGFDFLALSFVRRPDDVRELKERLRELGARPASPEPGARGFSRFGGGARDFIPVVSKIEKPQALDEIEAIIEESDGIMVARGDLGVEMDLAEVPVIQKRIVRLCRDAGKPVVVATQMLQSMIEAPSPTRAEVSDVANAIFDGATVMLSGETAVGRWPVDAVRMMRRIAARANAHLEEEGFVFAAPEKVMGSRYRTAALAHGVGTVARDVDAKLVVVWSQLGGGALYIAQTRMPIPVLAFSSDAAALRRMAMQFGVQPIFMEEPDTAEKFLRNVDRMVREREWAEQGDPIVFAVGDPIGRPGITNSLRIHYVGESGPTG